MTYDQYYKKYKEQYGADALAEYEKHSEQNKAISDQYIADIGAAIDKSTESAVGKVDKQITELPTYYQSAYDANAIQEKINERKVAERMANLGLTDSGLNRTQQTALMVSKMNTDSAITQQKNAAVASLKQQIADLEASGELEKMEIEATEKANLATTNKNLYAKLMTNADSRAQSAASSAYEADRAYAAAALKEKNESAKIAVAEAAAAAAKAADEAAAKAEAVKKADSFISSSKYDHLVRVYARGGEAAAQKLLESYALEWGDDDLSTLIASQIWTRLESDRFVDFYAEDGFNKRW